MPSTTTDRRYGVNTSKAIKVACKVCSTASLTLSGEQTIDGVSCVTGDRVLLAISAGSENNGIWVIDSGSWSRALDFDDVLDVAEGTMVYVSQGNTNGQAMYRVTNTGTITPGTTSLTFSKAAFGGSMSGATFLQGGSGAVAYDAQDRMRETISIFDFMTDAQREDVKSGTASIDVTTAIQDAINAAYNSGGTARAIRGYGKCRITSKLTIKCSIIGDGPFDSGGGFTFVWHGSGSTVCENTSPDSGYIFENLRVDMRNVTTDTLAFDFTRGLVGSHWKNVRFYGWDDGNGFFSKTFKNHDGIRIQGDNGSGGKADVSLNHFERLYFGSIRRGFETTDPYAGAAGGESSFIDCFGLCEEWVFRTTGRGNTWVGGDFAARTGFSVWKFSGQYASGNVIHGCSAETETSGDYAIICDADTSAAGSMGSVIGGKVYTGGWWNDLGLGTKLQRWTRFGDEDGLSSFDGKGAFLRCISALTTDVTRMGGVVGQGGKMLSLRADSGTTSGQILLANSASTGSDPAGPTSIGFVIGDTGNSDIKWHKTSDGTTLTEFFRLSRTGQICNTGVAPTMQLELKDASVADGGDVAAIGASFTASMKLLGCTQSGSASYNAANCAMKVAQNVTTSRSINAAGTVNASGADYAEYERKRDDCRTIQKSQIVGFDTDGLLTDKFSLAVRFGVKSTNPSFVGGDVWGAEDIIGNEPVKPTQREAVTQINETQDGEPEIIVIEPGETDEEFAARMTAWGIEHTAWRDRLEAERAKVDRIAYSGKVPCNVTGAQPGDYIIAAAGPDDTIIGMPITSPLFNEYRNAVGRVNRILLDGSAEIAVIVH